MRVGVLTSTPSTATEGSGTFVAVDGLVRGLTRLGHDVRVRPLALRTGFHTFDRWLYNLHAAVLPPDADLVVGVDLDGFLWARRRHRCRFVVALKGIVSDELRNERGWVRVLLGVQARWEQANTRLADRVVVPSEYSAAVAHQLYGVPATKLAVVPEPIDVDEWRRRLSAADPGPPARPTVLAVARMYPRKRLKDLLEAAARLRTRIPDVQVRIIGDGPESDALRHLHRRLGLGDTVVFLGAVPLKTLAVEYRRAHCFCLPTVQEGFGIVFLEAMAAGLAIVACQAAAVPEVVAHERTGLLVEPRQPDGLADAIETLLRDEARRREYGQAGMKRVEEFDLVAVARRFVDAATS